MREIKFRAWLKTDNRMCSILSITFENKWSVLNPSAFLFAENGTPGEIDQENYTLEQYTGLKDKNGKEIYEGDVVSGDVDGEIFKNCIILFYLGAFCIKIREDYIPSLYYVTESTMVIIGNIHSNPELLKEQI